MTGLVRRREPQDLKQVLKLAEAVARRESRMKTTLTVVLSLNLVFVFGAITLAALLLTS